MYMNKCKDMKFYNGGITYKAITTVGYIRMYFGGNMIQVNK